MPIDIKQLCHNFTYKAGIFFHFSDYNTISYPQEGSDIHSKFEDQSFWYQHRNNLIVDTVKKWTSGKQFWDIGGGNGYVSSALDHQNINVVLLEPCPNGCANAHKRGLKNIICATPLDLSFEHKYMEAAGLFDVLEHIQDPVDFLTHLPIQKDGYLFITVPAYRWLFSNEDITLKHYRGTLKKA